ncbi:transporter substrate-binding domain-containing protein [Methanoregula sp.]|uniref:transporter substrate-binding domain-containing protein n=1 Tax=Methanoregula sp. TaxID=2052170 RepID=UPI00261E80F6|nr:transporter substrate-binding domain-containing protein [Methanoregula sp.]MDD5143317.1 transporter substrate-binding domain-containing protein [Methanoregula sp.]
MLTGPRTTMRPLPNLRTARVLKQAFVLSAVILLFCQLVVPVATARDVRVALPELRPSVFTDDQGQPAGLFVEIIQDIAGKEGWHIIWVKGSLQESWARLAEGEIDLMMGVAETPERQVFYDFNREPVLSAWSQVYARPESGIHTILDLEGKRIAVLKGDINAIEFRDYAKKFDINATYLEKDTLDETFATTAAGETDAMVGFSLATEQSANKYGLAETTVMFNPSSLVFAVPEGTNKDILTAIDRYLAEGKANPSSPYSSSMQKWFGMKGTSEVIPAWILWGLAAVAGLAGLFVFMNAILRREVRRKTAELSKQNENLQAEVKSRKRAEEALVTKNRELGSAYEQLTATEEKLRGNYQEINAAYAQLTATEEELREKYEELSRSEQALTQAREKLVSLNALTFEDLRNAAFSLEGYLSLARQGPAGERVGTYLGKSEEILHSVRHAMEAAKKYQDLGINPPRWQNVKFVLLNALSHLDFSGISRVTELDELEIFADPLLEDVFFILMENVLHHGKGATEVRIRSREEAAKLTITIEDNGPGIPDAAKEKIFSRDYKATKGGSGLFLAREILSISGITIRETGVPGNGTRFEIVVPESRYRKGGQT